MYAMPQLLHPSTHIVGRHAEDAVTASIAASRPITAERYYRRSGRE